MRWTCKAPDPPKEWVLVHVTSLLSHEFEWQEYGPKNIEMEEPYIMVMFIESLYFLSNFYILKNPVLFEWTKFYSVESAFQCAKIQGCNEKIAKIFAKLTPEEAKLLGSKIKLKDNWDVDRLAVMNYLLIQKFESNTDLANKLIYTGDLKLAETNYWHDNFWVDCYCAKCKDIPGKNILGGMLMDIRKYLTLKKEQNDHQ